MSHADERLDGVGSWEVELHEDTPPTIVQALTLDQHDPRSLGAATLAVTNAHIEPEALGDASTDSWHPLFAMARYCGVLTSIKGRRRSLSGSGLTWHLGPPDDSGPMFAGSPVPGTGRHRSRLTTMTAKSYIEWLVLGGTRTASDGSAANITIRASQLYGVDIPVAGPVIPYIPGNLLTRRTLIDLICQAAGWTWYVSPDFVLHAGPAATLHPVDTNDSLLVASPLLHTPDPGHMTLLTGPDAVDWDEDMAGWANQLRAIVEETTGTWWTWEHPNDSELIYTYRGPRSALLHMAEVPPEGQDDNALAWTARHMSTTMNLRRSIRRSVTLSGRLFDHGRRAEVGRTVHVYDPDVGLVDPSPTAELYVSGAAIHPVTLPLYGIRWNFERGMGVYLVYRDRTDSPPSWAVLDLTPFVEFSDDEADTTLTVGAPQWTLGRSR